MEPHELSAVAGMGRETGTEIDSFGAEGFAAMNKCSHENFAATVNVNRLTKSDDDATVIAHQADIRINCAECGLPFEFVGVDAGMLPNKPMASVDAQELRAPIRPKGCKILPAIPGFSVRAN